MASKKFLELQDFTDEELANELVETETQYGKMKFDHTLKGLDNPLTLRAVRRDLARLKTEVRKRELAAQPDAEGRTKIIARRRRQKHS